VGVVTHGPLPTVVADPTQLRQVFQNLIGNAIKYRGERSPEVHIDVEHRAGEWQFTMRDNGIGIDRSISSAFSGSSNGCIRAGNIPGLASGWRLKIIERHGGRIWGVATRRRLDFLLHHS
jgi:chemotaxis family two-component system sensor kinase Cph1